MNSSNVKIIREDITPYLTILKEKLLRIKEEAKLKDWFHLVETIPLDELIKLNKELESINEMLLELWLLSDYNFRETDKAISFREFMTRTGKIISKEEIMKDDNVLEKLSESEVDLLIQKLKERTMSPSGEKEK